VSAGVAGPSGAVAAFDAMCRQMRDDDAMLQRDWTTLRCRPGATDDAAWEAHWHAACRADVKAGGAWERDARECLARIAAAGRSDDSDSASDMPSAPLALRTAGGGLSLTHAGETGGERPLRLQRQALLMTRWAGLPCPRLSTATASAAAGVAFGVGSVYRPSSGAMVGVYPSGASYSGSPTRGGVGIPGLGPAPTQFHGSRYF
jgi:hypothetical protein